MLRMLAGSLVVARLFTGGFAVHDLTKLPTDPAAALGKGFVSRAEAARLTLTCANCDGFPMVDVRLGRQDDGTEARVRSGTTTIAQLERLCQQRDPACRMIGLPVAPAVGWMTTYKAGSQFAHTIIVLRDGDLLTIRVLSGDAAVTRRHADVLVKKLVPQVVGA